MIFSLFFPESGLWHFMQIVSTNCQNLFSGKYMKNILTYLLLRILSSMVGVKGELVTEVSEQLWMCGKILDKQNMWYIKWEVNSTSTPLCNAKMALWGTERKDASGVSVKLSKWESNSNFKWSGTCTYICNASNAKHRVTLHTALDYMHHVLQYAFSICMHLKPCRTICISQLTKTFM